MTKFKLGRSNLSNQDFSDSKYLKYMTLAKKFQDTSKSMVINVNLLEKNLNLILKEK